MKNHGITLIELMITMAISIIVLMALFESFLLVLKSYKQQTKIAEANIEKLAGLEILRKDIEMAGFGLPWDLNGNTYNEAASDSSYTPNPASAIFNDAPSNPPRAFAFSNNGNTNANNSDVLVIKSSIAKIGNSVARKWGYAYYDALSSKWKIKSLAIEDFQSGDYYIALTSDTNRRLQGYFNSLFPSLVGASGDVYLTFGINTSTPRMPFNRVDYYLRQPSIPPKRCSPNSYELYRAEINQGDGKRSEQPILDCVKDFQVAFGLDVNGDRVVDTWRDDLNLTDSNGNGTIADEIRKQVKAVKVFILIQEGQRDKKLNYSKTINLGDDLDGNGSIDSSEILSTFTPSGDDVHYRWKLLQMTVNPINLQPQER